MVEFVRFEYQLQNFFRVDYRESGRGRLEYHVRKFIGFKFRQRNSKKRPPRELQCLNINSLTGFK